MYDFIKHSFHQIILRICILVIFATGLPVGSTPIASDYEESSLQTQKKKKKPTKKKKSTKPQTQKSRKKKKPSRKKGLRKKRPTKKKKPTRRRRRKPTTKKKPVKKPVQKVKEKRRIGVKEREAKPTSVYQLSDEIYRLTYQLDLGIRELKKAKLRLKPIETEKGKREREVNKFQLAEERVALKPENLTAQRELALEYERKGMFSKARDIYLHMISLDPSNADYHYFLGSLYSKSGQHRKAKFAYEEALEIDPNHTATINALSLYAKSPEDKRIAKELYEKAATQAPQGPAGLLSKIRDNLSSDRSEEALSLSQEGKSRFPDNYIFPYLEGKAYESLDQIEEAKKSYKQSIGMNRTDPAATIALADLYYQQGNYLYAAINYENVLSLQPLDIDLRFKYGLSYFKAYEWTKAASAWEDLLNYSPNHPKVHHLLPQVYYIMSVEYNRNGYTDLGRKAFSNALSVNPNSNEWLDDALKMMGEYYRENELYRNALHAYQDAIDINPTDTEAYNGLGITYWSMNEQELAKAAWERSLSIQPENNSARGWLLLSKKGTGS